MDYSLNSQNFEQDVLKSSIPVLVDFSADWCGPCKMMAPVIDELADMYEGELKVGKINVDQSPDIAQKYNVMSIPMFAFFKNGEVVETAVGALNKAKLQAIIDKVLA
ncbi:MAG: thioredoxin [Butyrivibrio sp.]|jgi:thioredoxin 1|nr:thioredoxin [Butyrivibrio sp.]MBQ6406707.1 thioredoxin [Butyrivibrio sp.]